MSDSRKIAKRMQEDHVASYINPVTDTRDALRRKGIQPKGFHNPSVPIFLILSRLSKGKLSKVNAKESGDEK